eukprot:Sdes_comp19664_c0_seq2m11516
MHSFQACYAKSKTALGIDFARLEALIAYQNKLTDCWKNLGDCRKDVTRFHGKWTKKEKNADFRLFNESFQKFNTNLDSFETEMLNECREFSTRLKAILALERQNHEIHHHHKKIALKYSKMVKETRKSASKKDAKTTSSPPKYSDSQIHETYNQLLIASQQEKESQTRLEYEKVQHFKQCHASLAQSRIKYHIKSLILYQSYLQSIQAIPQIPNQFVTVAFPADPRQSPSCLPSPPCLANH